MLVGVRLPVEAAEAGMSTLPPQYRVVGAVGTIIADIVSGTVRWSEGERREWVCVTPHPHPETFKPANAVIDRAAAWVRERLPVDSGRAVARSIAEAMLTDAQTLQMIAQRTKDVLASRIQRDIDQTKPGYRLIGRLMNAICEHPAIEGRCDQKGARIYAYTVQIGVSRRRDASVDRLTVPGMVIVSTAVSGADDRGTKSAVLYCAGVQKGFKGRAFGSMETSLAEFVRHAQTKPLSAFPCETLSLGEMLPFYLKWMVPDFAQASDTVVFAELTPCHDDIFERMAADTAQVILRCAGAPLARDFTSEAITRHMWRAWLGDRPDAGITDAFTDASAFNASQHDDRAPSIPQHIDPVAAAPHEHHGIERLTASRFRARPS
ncbi:hypothetical protein [Pandoraea anhela]|nr:hypothetical protein [Pandoraea anhela]